MVRIVHKRYAWLIRLTLIHMFFIATSCTEMVLIRNPNQGVTMDELLRELKKYPEVSVTIRTGIEHWRNGEITLVIHGSGIVEVQNLRSGVQRTFTGQIDHNKVEKLGKDFANAGFTTLKPTVVTRKPGDMPVVLMISRDDEQLYGVNLWYGDRYSSPGLDMILKHAEKLIASITNGVLPFGN